MKDKVDMYMKISLEIIEAFKVEDYDRVDVLLNKRQDIINEEENKEKLKILLVEDGVLEIDKQISILFDESIMKIKKEIRKYKVTKIANNSYTNSNRKNLQIFHKKV